MNETTHDWIDEAYDTDYLDDIEIDTNIVESDKKPLKARQKLEIYRERKRLEKNLYDVFTDIEHSDTDKLLHTYIYRDDKAVTMNAHQR